MLHVIIGRYPQRVRLWAILLIAVSVISTGCSQHVSGPAATDPRLKSFKTFYLIHNDSDERGLSAIIQNELAALGKEGRRGPPISTPANVDAIVTYYQDWRWDLTWYLLNLLIQFRDPETLVLLGSAVSHRTSLARTEPEAMTREVLEAILK